MRKIILALVGILALLGIGAILILAAENFLVLDSVTRGYVYFQIIVFLAALGVLWRIKGWYTHTNTAGSILTMVGVFGTFIGIYVGLQEFNPDALQDSIEVLLNGLKIAFGTSIVGIGSALLLKGIISPFVQKFIQIGTDPNEEAIGKFVGALKEALESVETPGESNLSSKLETLTAAIKEDGKTTRDVLGDMRNNLTDVQGKTLTQLETLTNTVSDKNDLIIISQKDEATETRKTLTDMQSELTDRQNKAFIQLRTLTKTVASEHSQLRTDNKTTRDVLGDMRNDLTDVQGKTLTQLRTLTKTVSSEHNQLRKEFENFSKNVAESITELATKELISSLTKVIESFNTQLSTQFGDNFKQLNEAVGKTVEWQKQYRQDMDSLAKEFQIAADSIDKSRDSLKNIADSSSTIADKSGSIVTSATKLEPILHTLNDQLGAFSDLRQKANDAFPLIETRLDNLTTKFSSTVEKTIADSEKSMKTQRDTLEDQSTKLTDQFSQFKNVIDGLDDFTKQIDGVKTNLSDAVGDFQTSMNLQKQAVGHFNDSVATMESTLDQQLRKSIEDLGKDLAALSQHFVDDYTPLTQSLRQVLTIADGILPKQPGN